MVSLTTVNDLCVCLRRGGYFGELRTFRELFCFNGLFEHLGLVLMLGLGLNRDQGLGRGQGSGGILRLKGSEIHLAK